MTASEPTPPIASPSPAAPLASQLAANPCSHPSFDQFVATIAALRAPDGCPWDRTQTHQSIAHNMIEEAYEAVDAIEAVDVAHLREELGDVLLQVVLQSQIASDAGEFDIDDVCADVNEKMVRRHPHVFGEAQAANAGDVLDLWDRVKMAEKGAADEAADGAGERREGLLDGVPTSFPALMQAQKVSRKAASAGFEWDSLDDVWEKVREEVDELAGYRYLKRLSRTENLLKHHADRISLQIVYLRLRTLAHAGWHRLVEALPGDDLAERVLAERDLRVRSNEHVIEKLQAELASPTSEEPAEHLSALLLEYQRSITALRNANPSITALTNTASKAQDIERYGLRLELEQIQARYEDGDLCRSSYKRLRENVALMQVDLEDNV